MNKKWPVVLGLIAVVVITSIITFSISAVVFLSPNLKTTYEISFDQETVSYDSIKKFNQARQYLKENFYQEVDENKLLEGAVAGMAYALEDPYTVYYTKDQMDKILEASQTSEETYVGIGVTVIMDTDGLLTVVEPFLDSPAYNAGIKQGDKIIAVDDNDVTDIQEDSVIISMIKGPEDTPVTVTIYRPSEVRTIDFEIIRKQITIQLNIRSEILDGNIGYIRLLSFMDRRIDRDFKEHLADLRSQGIESLIVDVRDNTGGLYTQTINIVDAIVPQGVIVYTEDRNHEVVKEYSDNKELDIPLVVLINGNSASSSEIFAGAIKDHDKGTLIGTTSFGKGLVQQLLPLEDGSGIKVTISTYFTPSGINIHGTGIEPDVTVEQDIKYALSPVSHIPREEDKQLAKAIELLKETASTED